jgi:hypothetical protein
VSAILDAYQKAVETILDHDSCPGASTEELELFKSHFRASAYTCRLRSCPRTTVGFDSARLRHEHEIGHAGGFWCPFPGCHYPPFLTSHSLGLHREKCHASSPTRYLIRRVGQLPSRQPRKGLVPDTFAVDTETKLPMGGNGNSAKLNRPSKRSNLFTLLNDPGSDQPSAPVSSSPRALRTTDPFLRRCTCGSGEVDGYDVPCLCLRQETTVSEASVQVGTPPLSEVSKSTIFSSSIVHVGDAVRSYRTIYEHTGQDPGNPRVIAHTLELSPPRNEDFPSVSELSNIIGEYGIEISNFVGKILDRIHTQDVRLLVYMSEMVSMYDQKQKRLAPLPKLMGRTLNMQRLQARKRLASRERIPGSTIVNLSSELESVFLRELSRQVFSYEFDKQAATFSDANEPPGNRSNQVHKLHPPVNVNGISPLPNVRLPPPGFGPTSTLPRYSSPSSQLQHLGSPEAYSGPPVYLPTPTAPSESFNASRTKTQLPSIAGTRSPPIIGPNHHTIPSLDHVDKTDHDDFQTALSKVTFESADILASAPSEQQYSKNLSISNPRSQDRLEYLDFCDDLYALSSALGYQLLPPRSYPTLREVWQAIPRIGIAYIQLASHFMPRLTGNEHYLLGCIAAIGYWGHDKSTVYPVISLPDEAMASIRIDRYLQGQNAGSMIDSSLGSVGETMTYTSIGSIIDDPGALADALGLPIPPPPNFPSARELYGAVSVQEDGTAISSLVSRFSHRMGGDDYVKSGLSAISQETVNGERVHRKDSYLLTDYSMALCFAHMKGSQPLHNASKRMLEQASEGVVDEKRTKRARRKGKQPINATTRIKTAK